MGLEQAVVAIQATVQAPVALCANSVLAGVCLAVQGHADIQLPIGEPKPLSLYFISIALSGERKSAADSLATKAIAKKESILNDAYKESLPMYRDKKEIWDKARLNIVNESEKKSNSEEKYRKITALGDEPKIPLKPLSTFPEPTYSGLYKYLEQGLPSVGVFSSEGGQFMGGHAMKDENKMETAAGFNSFWDGTPLKRVRSGDGTSSLYGRRLSMHLMAQPETAMKLMSDRMMEDQGFCNMTGFPFFKPDKNQDSQGIRANPANPANPPPDISMISNISRPPSKNHEIEDFMDNIEALAVTLQLDTPDVYKNRAEAICTAYETCRQKWLG
jgi:hypothetical protein